MRQPLFQVDEVAKLLVRTIYEYRVQKKYLLHEFVVMKDHVHLMVTPTDITLERAVQFMKGGFSHRLGEMGRPTAEVWQRGFTDHRIRGAEDFAHHREYLHLNPVRAGMCLRAQEYLFSSANPMYKKDPIPQRLKPSLIAGEWHG
jgi:putative transposase